MSYHRSLASSRTLMPTTSAENTHRGKRRGQQKVSFLSKFYLQLDKANCFLSGGLCVQVKGQMLLF